MTDPSKNDVIRKYFIPKYAYKVRRCVVFSNYYRRLVKKFPEITRCLINYLKKDTSFICTLECQQNFDMLKQKLIFPPVLQFA